MLTQKTSIAFSGNIPVNYDSYLGPMFFEPFALDMANRLADLPVQNLLELASGTGRLTKLLLSLNHHNTKIIASDINPAMVSYGSYLVNDPALQWLEIDAVEIPFPDESFDCVVVQFGVMFYSDRVRAFKEARRVLKPGGIFIFNCWDHISQNPMPSITNDVLEYYFPLDTPAFYSIPFSYYDEKLIRHELTRAGFFNIEIELLSLQGYSASAAAAAKGLIEGTPTVTAIEERNPEILPALLEELEKRIEKQFGRYQLQVPLKARVVKTMK